MHLTNAGKSKAKSARKTIVESVRQPRPEVIASTINTGIQSLLSPVQPAKFVTSKRRVAASVSSSSANTADSRSVKSNPRATAVTSNETAPSPSATVPTGTIPKVNTLRGTSPNNP